MGIKFDDDSTQRKATGFGRFIFFFIPFTNQLNGYLLNVKEKKNKVQIIHLELVQFLDSSLMDKNSSGHIGYFFSERCGIGLLHKGLNNIGKEL